MPRDVYELSADEYKVMVQFAERELEEKRRANRRQSRGR